MTIMQQVLDVLELNKGVVLNKIFSEIQLKNGKVLSEPDKSNLRNCLFKLHERKIIKKTGEHGAYVYTLVKDKSTYKPRVFLPKEQRRVETKPRPIRARKKIYKPLEWYALRKKGEIEGLCKTLNTPIPRTRTEIESFYNTVKSQTI